MKTFLDALIVILISGLLVVVFIHGKPPPPVSVEAFNYTNAEALSYEIPAYTNIWVEVHEYHIPDAIYLTISNSSGHSVRITMPMDIIDRSPVIKPYHSSREPVK